MTGTHSHGQAELETPEDVFHAPRAEVAHGDVDRRAAVQQRVWRGEELLRLGLRLQHVFGEGSHACHAFEPFALFGAEDTGPFAPEQRGARSDESLHTCALGGGIVRAHAAQALQRQPAQHEGAELRQRADLHAQHTPSAECGDDGFEGGVTGHGPWLLLSRWNSKLAHLVSPCNRASAPSPARTPAAHRMPVSNRSVSVVTPSARTTTDRCCDCGAMIGAFAAGTTVYVPAASGTRATRRIGGE